MSLSDSVSDLTSTSTLSLNSSHIDCPHPITCDCAMSLPRVRKRLRSLRPVNIKRRKVSQENLGSLLGSQPQQDTTVPVTTQPASSSVKGQVTVTVITQDCSSDEPLRKRDIIPQWLDKQAQRLERLRWGSLWHRDSMFDGQDFKNEPKQAAQYMNITVSGPHSEPVPQRAIDHFFALYPAGGSDWKNSARWERHLAKCTGMECAVCKATRVPPRISPSLARLPALSPVDPPTSPPSSPPVRSSTESPLRISKDSYFSVPLWRSSKRRQNRGKSSAPDEMDENPNSMDGAEHLSPRTQVPRYLEPPVSRIFRSSRPGIVIHDGTTQFERRVPPPPVRCSSVSKPVDASKIPVPGAPDLRPPRTIFIDIDGLSHITGRPYEISPLELLQFPLSQYYNTPSTPQLKPEQDNAPVPEMEHLTDTSWTSSDESLEPNTSPVLSAGPSATNLQRWPAQPPNPDVGGYSIAEMLSQDEGGLEMPTLRQRRAAAGTSTQSPPTPPYSRHTSYALQGDFSHATHASQPAPPVRPVATPEGPADRDWATCVLSDTTGSLLPDCPTYVNPREKLDKYWAGMAERHGPGMRIWR